MNNIGKKISVLREHKKISQKKLAQKANLSQSFISHIEHGKRTPTITTIGKIAEGLNVALKYFLLYIIGEINIKLLDKRGEQNVTMESKEINKPELLFQNIDQKLKEIKRIINISNKLDKKITQKYGEGKEKEEVT